MRPFRFSVMASSAHDGAGWATLARRVESLGYDALMMPDHVGRQLGPIAGLAAAAATTSRLRVAPFVLANDFRHPYLVAEEAATIDRLSGGRLLLGLGAGWRVTDYRQLGLPYEAPSIRVDRLVEAVGIIKRLMSGETVTHTGPHYRLDRARLAPLPVQQPHPPLIIGGGGPRMLRFAAREADVVAIIPQIDRRGRPIVSQATEAGTAQKAALVRQAAGDRWGAIDLNVLVFYAGLVDRRSGVVGGVRNAAFASAVGLVGTPYVLHGTLGRVRDILLRRRERWGLNSYTFTVGGMESMAPLVEALAGR
jgi:probable F420-dependent oxidoreductase